jgi:acyl-CoA reductase-like NAD-dependent aldehyde dehydrogenase
MIVDYRDRINQILLYLLVSQALTDELAHIETVDTGKPIWESRFDIAAAADAFEYNGGLAPAISGQHVQLPRYIPGPGRLL